MRILFITMGYPSNKNRSRLVFLQRLVNEMVDLGHECTVIAPTKRFHFNEGSTCYEEVQSTNKNNQVHVYFPKYTCIYLTSRFKNDIFSDFSVQNYIDSVKEVINKEHIKFDCIYSHFVGTSAIAATTIGAYYKVPTFAAAGESEFKDFYSYDHEKTITALNKLTGIISVSTENKKILISNNVLDNSKIKVFPNGVDTDVFYPRDKEKSREIFGFNKGDFIIGFVGHFIERKGPLRLQKSVTHSDIKIAYAGKGEQVPVGNNIIYKETVSPVRMPDFLSSVDLFVLPTQNEGCCNSIIEALACGVPVISSDLAFNDDILDDSCSLRVDPNNINQIKKAIDTVFFDKNEYALLKEGALKKGQTLSLERRAINIINWMQELMEVNN